MQHPARAEAERLLGISEKLLQTRDLNGSREFAILAQETEPLLEGSDQILAIVDVLIAAEKQRVNNHPDWYALLQVDRRSDDIEAIKRQYRRLALLLHPDKSRFPFSDHAFNLVTDAWAVLSDPIKKSLFDKELSFFSRVDLTVPSWVQQEKLPVRRTGPGPGPGPIRSNVPGFDFDHRNNNTSASAARDEIAAEENSRRRPSSSPTFWSACPYCYRLYEYPRVYEGCCLRCQNCDRSFHGIAIPSLPPMVPGQDAYYCCWGFFPMGFVAGSIGSGEKEGEKEVEAEVVPVPVPPPPQQQSQPVATGLPNWMPAPPPPTTQATQNGGNNAATAAAATTRVTRAAAASGVPNGVPAQQFGSTPRKRGRPRKYPLAS